VGISKETNFSQVSHYPSRGLNQEPYKYKSEALLLELTCLIKPRLQIAPESIDQSINQSIDQSVMPFPRDKSTASQSRVQVKNEEYKQISRYTDTYTRVTGGKEERLIFSSSDLHFLLRRSVQEESWKQ